MTYLLQSPDLSALVFARQCLISQDGPKDLEIVIGGEEFKGINMQDLWKKQVQKATIKKKKITLAFDQHNHQAKTFAKSTDHKTIELEMMKDMANQNWADTVEFRRISRKFIRKAKSFQTDFLVFLDPIFGDEKTQKILQQLAGTQIKVITPKDVWDVPKDSSKKLGIHITSSFEAVFTKKQSEILLKKKLKNSDITLRRV